MVSTRLVVGLAWCFVGWGQELPSFDVASVKANTASRPDYIETGVSKHGTVTLHNANMKDCLRYAYGLTSNDQIAGPDWMADYSVRFDIVAKAPAETPQDALMGMLQRLLEERFHLALHRESKVVAHFDLELAKGGAKLPASPEEPVTPRYVFGRGALNYPHTSADAFAMLLSRQLKLPVFNRTGLEGFYDFKLQWRPDEADAADDPRLELSEALAQMGLKLNASKAPIIVLVVDHADRVPVGN